MKLNKVQIISIVVAVVLAGISAMVLLGILPGLRSSQEQKESLAIWGFHQPEFLGDFLTAHPHLEGASDIQYTVKNFDTWESELLNILARGGDDIPDIVIFPSDYLERQKDKLSFAPFALLTEKDIKDQFIEAGDVFLGGGGEVFGVPFYADALVLYWNKDLFTRNFITLPPKTWDEFLDIAGKITKKDSSGAIVIAGAALGRGVNIKNAPLIASTMFLQGGDSIIDEAGNVVLGEEVRSGEISVRPAESVLRFISDFANPLKVAQSWSPAMPEAREAFLSDKLGMYLGTMSEYRELKNRNPHLNFAVAPLPQLKDSPRHATGGTLYAWAVLKASKKQQAAWTFIKFMSNYENSSWYADRSGSVSLRRDLIPQYQKETVKSVFAEAALTLKLWPVPDPKAANQIFRDMIEDITFEKTTLREALSKAGALLSAINQ